MNSKPQAVQCVSESDLCVDVFSQTSVDVVRRLFSLHFTLYQVLNKSKIMHQRICVAVTCLSVKRYDANVQNLLFDIKISTEIKSLCSLISFS